MRCLKHVLRSMQSPKDFDCGRRAGLRWLASGGCGALAFLMGLPAAAPGQAQAQGEGFPHRPVRLIIPFAPGGPTDLIGRVLARHLGQALDQQVVVENKPGASGAIGAQTVAKADGDGYTLLFHEVVATFAIQPSIAKSLPYNVGKDFTPIALAARGPAYLLVNGTLPVKNVRELVALAKDKPDTLPFASAGGSGQLPTHIGPELLKVKQDIKVVHVPYKGTGPALVDVAAGRVAFMITTGTGSARLFLDSGQIRAIAVTGTTRSEAMPDVPTFAESGVPLPELDHGTVWGLFAPAAVPPDRAQRLNEAASEALRSPELRKSLASLDIYPESGSAQALQALISQEAAIWPPLLKKMAIQAE